MRRLVMSRNLLRKRTTAVEFPKLTGVRYKRFLKRMHMHMKPNWYLEVGTSKGDSFALAVGNSIGVDPKFQVSMDFVGVKPQAHLYQMTSDEFFAGSFAQRHTNKIDFAFLDGMHLFEFLLRDFIATEKLCGFDSTITMHDCVPMTQIAAERHWDKSKTISWTGDVWKLVPILKRYRPDLIIEVLDCPPSGLTVVTNLDPKNNTLECHYDEILNDFMELSLGEYGEAKLFEELDITDSRAFPGNRFVGVKQAVKSIPSFSASIIHPPTSPAVHLDKPIHFSIKNPAPNDEKGSLWGETFFANGLASALARKGHNVTFSLRQEWNNEDINHGVDIILRKPTVRYTPKFGRPALIWVLYGGDDLHDDEIESASHIFVASNLKAASLQKQYGTEKVTPLLQAFDSDRMSPDGPCIKSRVLYVGNDYAQNLRRSVELALKFGVDIDLYGRWWRGSDAKRFLRAKFVENSKLASYYRGAQVVLNDHVHGMGTEGFVSNRVFDVLATGTPIVSDTILGLPSDMSDWVSTYSQDSEFPTLIEAACNESSARVAERVEFARHIRGVHSFDQRVSEIIEAARQSLGGQ